jgi:signal transduction histidine kinase
MPDSRTPEAEPQRSEPVEPGSSAGDRLLANQDRILTMWLERLRRDVAAAGREPRPILVNTLPAVLDQLAEALLPDHPRRTATQGSTVAHEHGGERVRLTHFGLEDLIAEYKILREILFEVLEQHEPLSREERHTLNVSMDQAITEACTGYVLVQSNFRDQFFATMAHDLRNPLNAAQAAAALVLQRSASDDVSGWARRIIENIGRVDRMVQDLLNAMRVQAGARLHLEIVACDLVEVVRHTIDGLRAEHGDRIVLVAPEPVHGFLAPDPLQRAVENLADNAVKYGAPSRSITVTVRETHGRAIVTVHNHGPHIPVDKQETLFRAFQRLSDPASSGQTGWGLGLAQVRAVAEAHGGSISVDSVPDRGTTFLIDIPLDARPYQTKPITPTPLNEPLGR